MKRIAGTLAAMALTLGVGLTTPALAASNPVVTTGTATSVTASSATLTGTVNPSGSSTSYYFQYGTTTAYTQRTATTAAGTGTAAVSVQAAVTNLTPDTTYHFRIVATNASGNTAMGTDQTLTTGKLPPVVATGAATALTGSTATLNATVNPGGKATTYTFQYGPTTAYGAQTATVSAGAGTTPVAVHATVTKLVSDTAYHFRVVATNADGTSIGADAAFTTAPVPPTIANQRVSFINSSSASVSVNVNPNGKATTFTVEYGPTPAFGLQTTAAAIGAGTKGLFEHASIIHLSSGTVYYYRVVATSPDGTTTGPTAQFQTTGRATTPTGPLPAVSHAAAAKIGAHAAQLNGAINPRGPSTTWYFEVGLTSAYGMQTHRYTISGFGARAVNTTLTGLQQGTTYHFRLIAYDSNGLYVGPDHTFSTRRGQRMYTHGIAVYAQTQRVRNLVIVHVHGRLLLPASANAATVCSGTVGLEVRRFGETIHVSHTSLRANCRYTTSIYVLRSRLHGSANLTIVGNFWGNSLFKPARTFRNVLVR